MIHPTDLVENQTVKAERHLPMNPSCRTRESPVATNKFKEGVGSYAARLQQLCFTTIRLLWIAMMMKRPKFKIKNPRQRLLSGQRLKFCLERSIQTVSTLSFSATLSTSYMLGLQQQQQKSRFKSGVSSNWEKTLLQRRSINYWNAAPSLLSSPENGSVVKATCMETRSTISRAGGTPEWLWNLRPGSLVWTSPQTTSRAWHGDPHSVSHLQLNAHFGPVPATARRDQIAQSRGARDQALGARLNVPKSQPDGGAV
jgi:hypothetical protein